MPAARLVTDRFALHRFSRRDAGPLLEAVRASLPELLQWLPWAYTGYGPDDAASFVRESAASWKEGRAFDFAIRDPREPDVHLGNVSIWHISRLARTGEIGYWVRSDRTSRGVATEVTGRMLRLAFQEMAMHKVTLRIAVGNGASERVAEKLGFTKEGVLREELLIGGHWLDHSLFSLLEQEWSARLLSG